MKAEIISIGSELTSGAKLDTNSQWLSTQLSEIGIPVHFHATMADDRQTMLEVFQTAVNRSDIVLVTGGLGPTLDDLTRELIAQLTGTELVLDEPSLEFIEKLFSKRGRVMSDRNRIQAMFPAGSEVMHNPVGTAPGVWMEVAREGRPPSLLAAMPGVPSEMKLMYRDQVIPRLPQGERVIRRSSVHCFGQGESNIEEMLGDLTARDRNPEVGITASSATIRPENRRSWIKHRRMRRCHRRNEITDFKKAGSTYLRRRRPHAGIICRQHVAAAGIGDHNCRSGNARLACSDVEYNSGIGFVLSGRSRTERIAERGDFTRR